jgi:3',5'-nucleoside bisphosphate phosphatase
VLIDLHSHSNVSDGTTSPADLVRRAAEVGLDVIALTDHDTAAGWDEAAAAARTHRVCFVPGMEISTKHRGRSVHLLAYLVDPTHEELACELDEIVAGRTDRLAAVLTQLAAAEISLTEDEVRRQASPHAVLGRPHIADALVARALVKDRAEAFEAWLNPGQPGFVVRYAPSTSTMIRVVTEAGGAAVIAHPWGRATRTVLDRETLAGFAAAGLVGIEVDHQDHSPDDREALRLLAAELGLVATGSSDYHGAGKVDHDLGCNVTAPAELGRLIDAAAANALASGRRVPVVEGAHRAGLAT